MSFLRRIFRKIKSIKVIKNFITFSNNSIVLPKKSKIKLNINGKNNKIVFEKTSKIVKGKIEIYGNNNFLIVGSNNLFIDVDFWIEDSNTKIVIGNENKFLGYIKISSIEGGGITIGNNNLFSRNISISNGDSHSIFSRDGIRVNNSKKLEIKSHIWIGHNVIILKNGSLGDDIVIGAGSVVCNNFINYKNVVIAGNPAKVIKNDIFWEDERK